MESTKLTETGVEDRQFTAHGVPALPRSHRPSSFPYGKQVSHLKNGKYDKLEKCCCGKSIEQRFCSYPTHTWNSTCVKP